MTELLGALPVFRYRFSFTPEAPLALRPFRGSTWRGALVPLTTNEWLKARQVGPAYWLYVVWGPKAQGAKPTTVRDPANALEHAAKEIAGTPYCELPAAAIQTRCQQ